MAKALPIKVLLTEKHASETSQSQQGDYGDGTAVVDCAKDDADKEDHFDALHKDDHDLGDDVREKEFGC